MLLSRYLWLLLCYAQYARSNLVEEYEAISDQILHPRDEQSEPLPIELGTDRSSGCICRASLNHKVVVCFGNYECRKFPKVSFPSDRLRVRTTVIEKITKSDLDPYYYLKALEIEANHKLQYIESGAFRNLTKLEQLSLSYNTLLKNIYKDTFEGLVNLHNLTLVNNNFQSIKHLTSAFKPNILPSLRGLDISENVFESIPEDAFLPMQGTTLKRLDLNLCRLDYIHPNSLVVFKNLKELNIADNDLNSTIIADNLSALINAKIHLIFLDLSGMGFRKQPPRQLMDIISNSTVKTLILARNQFEIINDDAFPVMKNIELIDLRKVLAIRIGGNVFQPSTFPNLKILLLSGNNLPGMHKTPLSNQLLLLDLSDNKGSVTNPMYYEIGKDTFLNSKELRILNLAYNRIRSIFDYTFRGLDNLKILDLQNGSIYHIGDGSFKPLKKLEMLNLANNPLEENENFTTTMFEGLNELKILTLENCGIRKFYDDDNIFETMPNLTHLILKNNQLMYISAETIKPLKNLQVLDLSQNLLVSWWKTLFLSSGVKPSRIYLTNNKFTHFSLSMIKDISYLLENRSTTVDIDLMDNIFICDCSSMYQTYRWLQVNGTENLKRYFYTSKFQCSSPDLWEDKKVSDYLRSVKTLHCIMYEKISKVMVLVWTAPSLVTIALVLIIVFIVYKYRMYIRYWMFLAKLALGRNIKKTTSNQKEAETKGYKYDAFVSYCNEDREFVTTLIAQLENQPPYYKLCVYERDFEIGAFISDAVQKSITESKYIVLIISNNFAKSQWCRWETQLAEYHRIFLEDGTSYDPLVLVRIGEVHNKYLTTTLKYLLKTKIYHSWDEKNQDEFWRKLRNVLAKKK